MFSKLKKLIRKMFSAIRKKMRSIEQKLDTLQPHPIFGAFILLIGIAIVVAGVIMCIIPGPGFLTIALGIALIIISVKILQRKYNKDRSRKELELKIEKINKKKLK